MNNKNPSQQKSLILNYITAARGERVQLLEDDHITVGFKDIMFWIPSKQSWIAASQDPDKFQVTIPSPDGDYSTAWTEFYARWHKYISTRFPGLTSIKIESTNH